MIEFYPTIKLNMKLHIGIVVEMLLDKNCISLQTQHKNYIKDYGGEICDLQANPQKKT
jgi:hypothetical protein